MSQPPRYCSWYERPNNILIVPTVSFNSPIPSPMNIQKMDTRTQQGTEQNVSSIKITKNVNITTQLKPTPLIEHQPTPSLDQPKSIAIQDNSTSSEHKLKVFQKKLPTKDLNKNLSNVEDLNQTKKANSWASNYLQSIGHNNIKPIKITLSSARNKLQRIETISTTSNEPNKTIAQPTLLKGATSSYEVFNMTDDAYEFSKPNEKIIGECINVGNIKTLHPTTVMYGVDPVQMIPAFPRSDKIPSTLDSSIIALDTIYTKINSSSKAPAYASLLAKSNGAATYCYEDGKREIDILDAIKSKIDHESDIEQKSRMMNLPTHKDMCEEFIKEISSNKPSTSEKKRDRSKSSTTAKKEELLRHNNKNTTNLVKKDKKESLKTIKKKTSDKERAKKSKNYSSEKAKSVVKEKNGEQHHKKQSNKPIVDLKDFDILTEHIFAKEVDIQPKSERNSLERQHLKRSRTTSSEDQHKFRSEVHIHSPIRNLVKVAENSPSNSTKRQCINENFDLRSKLSRVNQGIHKKQVENDLDTKPKQRENLKITVEKQSDEKQKTPKKTSVLKYKTNKCKKLKLIINIVCQESDDEATSSDSSYNETHNMDLSFLDDFNVDEIVDSLKHSPKKHRSPSSSDKKMEYNTKMSAEPELKLATILNILHAKSETKKLDSLARTEYKIDETMKVNSSPILNLNKPITVPDVEMYSKHKAEENTNKINATDNTNTTHKILSQTKLQSNHNKNTLINAVSLEAKCDLQTEEINVRIMNTNREEQQSDSSDRLIIDESVIINEQEITIIDLCDETCCAAPETNNKTITDIPNYISCKKQCGENKLVGEVNDIPKPENVKKYENENYSNNKIQISLEEKNNKLAKTVYKMDVDVEKVTLHKNNENVTDLSNKNIDIEIYEAVEHNNANTQMDIESESTMIQEISVIPLPNENNEPHIHYCKKIFVKDIELQIKEKPKENVENLSSTDDVNSNTKVTATTTKPVKIVVNNDTVVCKETTINNKEKPQESSQNVSEVKEGNPSAKENKNITKIFDTKAAKNVLKTIVENVWDTNNDLMNENTSKTNSENKSENSSKTNTTEKKEKNESNLSGQHKALAVLLEERMLGYLHKEIKVMKHIRLGKYSNIFSCEDTSGDTYAAKILTSQNNRHVHGIEKEQMIRKLQQDIPRENLNTIYLIDGFGIQRYWCLLTEYYPKNLQQALKEQDKPLHIDSVQDLARQLISAVMVLRNNNIIHSDIKPTHILLNSTNDRLKLCGFDEAYYGNDYVYPVPNIGTVSYRAPEIIMGFSASYSIDVWSSALVIYQMATNQKLFSGVYNNDILYKQMCTFGNLPRHMLKASYFKNQHFRGRTFMRRVGFKGQDAVLFQKFYKTKRLQMSLNAAYTKYWQTNDMYERNSDMFKLTALHKLLEQMLILDPRLRLAIEFVCADPFIYEMFSF